MFRDTLFESSPAARKGKRWPMALAFAAEMMVATVLILVPLFSTGIIPVSARVPEPPLHVVRVAEKPPAEKPPAGAATGGTRSSSVRVLEVAATGDRITLPYAPAAAETSDDEIFRVGNCTSNCLPDGPPNVGNNSRPQQGPVKPFRISSLSEAQLVTRVEPTYPHGAILAHLQGTVKLHAFIAKDGTVQSLNVISGHPILATAALDAVRQWRYRPYILNGEPVEVETFITVTFKRSNQ